MTAGPASATAAQPRLFWMRCIDTCRRTSRFRWHLVTASPVLAQGEGSPRRHDDAVSGRPTRDRQHDVAHSIRRRGSRTTAGRDSVSLDLRRVSPVARGSPAPGDARQIETSGSAGCSAGRKAPNSGGWGEGPAARPMPFLRGVHGYRGLFYPARGPSERETRQDYHRRPRPPAPGDTRRARTRLADDPDLRQRFEREA